MKFYNYINEKTTEGIGDSEIRDFIKRWKMKLSRYGVTEFDLSIHGFKRLNHERNNPPILIDDLDFVLEAFLKKMGSQFKDDVQNVRNNTAKKRGLNKKQIPPNNLEFTVKSKSKKVNFVFVLKQDFNKKGTAIVLPMTMMRKKSFKVIKGEEVIVERRML
jgi:hypothetical protein